MGMRRSFNCGWCASKRTQRVVDSRAAVGDAPEADLPDNRSLFPVWTHSGRPQWCVLMQYACPTCKMRYLANDGRLLMMLELYTITSTFPLQNKNMWN